MPACDNALQAVHLFCLRSVSLAMGGVIYLTSLLYRYAIRNVDIGKIDDYSVSGSMLKVLNVPC